MQFVVEDSYKSYSTPDPVHLTVMAWTFCCDQHEDWKPLKKNCVSAKYEAESCFLFSLSPFWG